MQKPLAPSSRVALGVTLLGALILGGLGCGSSGGKANPDAKDAKQDGTTGAAGADASGAAGTGDATGTAGTDGGAGTAGTTGTAGTDGGAGAGGTGGGAAGTGAAGAVVGDAGMMGTDGGAGTTGTAGTDGGAGTTGTAGTDAGAGNDGGASDASDASDVACTNACTLGGTRCGSGGGIQTCVAAASGCTVWGTEATCGDHSVCSAASGTPTCGCKASACTTTGKFCSSATGRVDCSQDAQGCFFATGAEVSCGQRQSCTGVAGAATCTCNVDPSCATGTDTLCAGAGSVSHCALDADNCPYVASTTACPTHQSCTGNKPNAACTCNNAPTDCSAGVNTTFCATSASVSTCKEDANHCVFADVAVGCGTHQACSTPTLGAAACGCVTDTNCSAAGNTCVSGASVACAKDADNCFFTQTTTNCGTHETCDGTSGLCACNATVCTAAGKFCDGNGQLANCAQDTNPDGKTCLFLSGAATACSTNATCSGGAGSASCVCKAAPAGCTGAGTFCKGSGTQALCTTDGTCPASDAANDSACPPHQTCKGSGLGGACSCDNTCSAAQANGGVGTYCIDALHQSTCTTDVNSCRTASNTVTCVGVQTCQGADGVGACQCPAQGVTAGTGCSTLGATVCQGDIVLTCVSDSPASSCLYWANPHDCVPDSLVCGTKSGVAACQCAEHTGTSFYADPNAGSDAAAGVFATGNSSPAQCRFATLGKALSFATHAGDQVIATSTSLPAVFVNESFPLSVSAGVTLQGSVVTPTDAVIVFKGAATTGVSLATSSTFEGFEVINSNGNAGASAVSVAGTGVTVDSVDLEGTNGTTLASGINVSGQGLLNGVKVQGFTTGINVSTSSGVAVSLQNSPVIASNATGIALSNGTLSASSVTVDVSAGNGVIVGAATGAISTLNGTALTVSNSAGSGIVQAPSGGTATLNLTSGDVSKNAGGGISFAAGTGTLGAVNVHDNTGSGITQLAGTLTLGSGGTTTVQANTTKGVTLTGGTLTVGAGTISGNGSDGVIASVGATLVSNTGAQYVNNNGNGINATSATLTFNGAAAAPISVSNNTLDGILMSGGSITSSYLTLSANGTGTTKKSGLEATSVAAVSLGTATDSAVSITGNGLNGVTINGTTAGSAVDMRRAQINNNGGDGVSIDLNGGQGAVNATAFLSGLTVSGNTLSGIEVLRAPPANGTATVLTIDTLTATSNKGPAGVYLHGGAGALAASITGAKAISLNSGVGIRVDSGAGAVSEAIQNCDIAQNLGAGVWFNGTHTLTGFSGNSVHGNGGDQVLIASQQKSNAAYNFSNSSLTCDANRNSFYAYSTPKVGVNVTAAAVTVNAAYVSWKQSSPASGVDYIAGVGGTLTYVPTCAANTATQ